MAYSNHSSMRDIPVLHVNGNSSHTDVSAYDADIAAFLNSLLIFPTWISDSIFKSIYALGILTNVVLLAYLLYYKRYKTPVFCVILSLGVADFGVCFSGLLYYALLWPFITSPLWMCQVISAILYTSYVASSYHIAVFAVLRFIQLVYPLASHVKVTTSLLLKVCLTIWCLSSTQIIVGVYNYEPVDISNIENIDMYVCLSTEYRVFAICVIVFWIAIPFITTSGFHVAKQVAVMLSHSTMTTSQSDQIQRVRRQTDYRALAIAISTYLITILPYIVQSIRVYIIHITFSPTEAYLVEIFAQVAYSNSAINPWIYLFAADSVRSDVRKMILCTRSVG